MAESIRDRLDLLAGQLKWLQRNEGEVRQWVKKRTWAMKPEAKHKYADKLRGIHAVLGDWKTRLNADWAGAIAAAISST